MIRLVQPKYELIMTEAEHAFVLDSEIKILRPIENLSRKTHIPNIEIFDDKGHLFSVSQRPTIVPLCLWVEIEEMRKDLKKEIIEKTGVDIKHDWTEDIICCVDPRVLMIHILEWWRCPFTDNSKFEILNEAYASPLSYEEAEKWLTDNRFLGPKALRDEGYPGRRVRPFETPKTFKNLPEKFLQAIEKICELIKNDDTLSKKEKEIEINRWRIPKA